MKTCKQCDYENEDEMNFCVNCGNKLEDETPTETNTSEDINDDETSNVCDECGHENEEDMKFCVNCGNELNAEAVETQNNTEEETTTKENQKEETQEQNNTEEETTTKENQKEETQEQNNTEETPKSKNTNVKKEKMGVSSPKIDPNEPNKKFIKKEKKVVKKIDNLLCPVADLYFLSTTEEEYVRSADLFKEWVDVYVVPKLHKIWYFGLYEHWRNFKTNCIQGLFSLMVIGQYDECLVYCNKLLDLEETVYKKGIGSHTANGLIAGIKTFAALTGKTGNGEQEQLYQRIRLVKIACLYELGEYQEAKELIIQMPETYGFEFVDRDEYYNQNFKYKDTFFVKDFKNLLNV